MSTNSAEVPRSLPEHPNLRHLKDQAKDLLKSGKAKSLTEAQFEIARLYGFASWPKLKAHVESLEEIGQLKQAIDTNDLKRLKDMMTANPTLHRAPLGYNQNGPLTWVAECRLPWGSPTSERLAMAEWMIDNGSDIHQGGDGPLMRAALFGHRIPMMELLVSRGANVNAQWNGYFPIIFAPCETLDPLALQWLLHRGANPNCTDPLRKYPGTALDYVISTYARSEELGACIDVLLNAGGVTKYHIPAVLNLLRNRLDLLEENLDAEPALLHRRFLELDFGSTAARRLKLRGATLLHVAAEYGNVNAAKRLLDRGAEVNARAVLDESGVGGQTPIFHAVTQFSDWGLAVAQLLIDRGADLTVRAKIPGHYRRSEEFVDCTPLGYALRFPGADEHTGDRLPLQESGTVAFLRARGALE
jgi:ankyrin repeat protein